MILFFSHHDSTVDNHHHQHLKSHMRRSFASAADGTPCSAVSCLRVGFSLKLRDSALTTESLRMLCDNCSRLCHFGYAMLCFAFIGNGIKNLFFCYLVSSCLLMEMNEFMVWIQAGRNSFGFLWDGIIGLVGLRDPRTQTWVFAIERRGCRMLPCCLLSTRSCPWCFRKLVFFFVSKFFFLLSVRSVTSNQSPIIFLTVCF